VKLESEDGGARRARPATGFPTSSLTPLGVVLLLTPLGVVLQLTAMEPAKGQAQTFTKQQTAAKDQTRVSDPMADEDRADQGRARLAALSDEPERSAAMPPDANRRRLIPPDVPAPAGPAPLIRQPKPRQATAPPTSQLRGTADPLFGAPSSGILGAGPRCKLEGSGRSAPGERGCLTELAFNISPPPVSPRVIPTNLPSIPPQDMQQERPRPPARKVEKPGGMVEKPGMMEKPGGMVEKAPEKAPEKAGGMMKGGGMMEEDPYEAIGFTTGSFVLKPAVQVTSGYDSNPQRTSGGTGSPVVVVAPELLVRSQFEHHQLNADILTAYTDETKLNAFSHPTINAKVNGRYDVDDDAHADAEAHYLLDADDPGTARFIGRFTKIPLVTTAGGIAGFTQKFEPFEVSVKGAFDHVQFQDAPVIGGGFVSNKDRAFSQYGVQSRVTYELTPEYMPFIDVTFDRRVHDLPVDVNGFRRDSSGMTLEGGVTFALTDYLTGDAAVGYLVRRYDDAALPSVGGFIGDAMVTWQATKATSIQFGAKAQAAESTDAGVTSVFRHDLTIEVDHDFEPQLAGAVSGGVGQDQFIGSTRIDNRYFAQLMLTYKLSRLVQFNSTLRQEWLTSNMAGNNERATVATVGVRGQY
jgi:hypothetical protein